MENEQMKEFKLFEARTPLDDKQFNYMIEFALRQLNLVYYEGSGRTPIAELRLKIKTRMKLLNEMKK